MCVCEERPKPTSTEEEEDGNNILCAGRAGALLIVFMVGEEGGVGVRGGGAEAGS